MLAESQYSFGRSRATKAWWRLLTEEMIAPTMDLNTIRLNVSVIRGVRVEANDYKLLGSDYRLLLKPC